MLRIVELITFFIVSFKIQFAYSIILFVKWWIPIVRSESCFFIYLPSFHWFKNIRMLCSSGGTHRPGEDKRYYWNYRQDEKEWNSDNYRLGGENMKTMVRIDLVIKKNRQRHGSSRTYQNILLIYVWINHGYEIIIRGIYYNIEINVCYQ